VALCIEAFELMRAEPKPKIALLGTSARRKFENICNNVQQLHKHYQASEPFKVMGVQYDDWKDFEQEVEDRELPYSSAITLLHKFCGSDESEGGDGVGGAAYLPELVKQLLEHVVQRSIKVGEHDVLLATPHQAKGLEWDQVKVLDDFVPLLKFEEVPKEDLEKDRSKAADAEAAKLRGSRLMQFALKNDWTGDELNCWYVAVTRPRRRLQLGETFWQLHQWLWANAGLPTPEEDDEEAYTQEQHLGIEELRQRMVQELPVPGDETGMHASVTDGAADGPQSQQAVEAALQSTPRVASALAASNMWPGSPPPWQGGF
jgi:superfamily I DNA/RNA helicase